MTGARKAQKPAEQWMKDAAKESAREIISTYEICRDESIRETIAVMIEGYIAARAPQQEGWISVEERLPEAVEGAGGRYSVRVLTSDKDRQEVARYIRWRLNTHEGGYWTNSHIIPTHWMPLPSPPKEKP